jgi:hypothetical protein
MMRESTALLVLGMHRSGTSAFTGTLRHLGVSLGNNLLAPNFANPSGFWENAGISYLQERLMQHLGGRWDYTGYYPEHWWQQEGAAPFIAELKEVLEREFATSPLWAVKDPRTCRLMPLWHHLLPQYSQRQAYILVFRHPFAVADSLARRDGLSWEQSLQMWLQHVLESEVLTRGQNRVFVDCADLFTDWKSLMTRVAGALAIEWPQDMDIAEQDITPFLQADKLAVVEECPLGKHLLADWAVRVYAQLQRWSAGKGANTTILDQIHEALKKDIKAPTHAHLHDSLSKALNRAEQGDALIMELREQLQDMRKAYSELESSHQAQDAEFTKLQQSFQEMEATASDYAEMIAILDTEKTRLAREEERLRAELQEIHQSRVWRMTASLRGEKKA